MQKQVGRLEALQLADDYSTGLGRRGRLWNSTLDGTVDL